MNGLVEVLCDDGTIAGVLRYSLFRQPTPFPGLICIDEVCRGQEM